MHGIVVFVSAYFIDYYMEKKQFGVEHLYSNGPYELQRSSSDHQELVQLIRLYSLDKRFASGLLHLLDEQSVGLPLLRLGLRMPPNNAYELKLQKATKRALEFKVGKSQYQGKLEQNRQIRASHDYAVAGGYGSKFRESTRNGFGSLWDPTIINLPDVLGIKAHQISIGIIGAGPAGIIAGSSLVAQGLRPGSIHFYDPEGFGGIWHLQNKTTTGAVYNNPGPVTIGDTGIPKGPGDGSVIRNMLADLTQGRTRTFNKPLPLPIEQGVKKIHEVSGQYEILSQVGDRLGRHHIIIDTASALHDRHYSKSRFPVKLDGIPVYTGQKVLTPPEMFELKKLKDKGKKVAVLGMGNSALFMINQFQQHNIDYMWLTDISTERLRNPYNSIDGKPALARSVAQSTLTNLSLDLKEHKTVYEAAWREGKIKGGVQELTVNASQSFITSDGKSTQINFGAVWCVIGQEVETLSHHGLCEYDGELRDNPGYFVLGRALAIADTFSNAAVIPGIVGQMPHLTLGVAMRMAQIINEKI